MYNFSQQFNPYCFNFFSFSFSFFVVTFLILLRLTFKPNYMKTLLETKEVSKYFGEFQALDAVSIQVPKHSIFGLLGPNGAGKTTLIRIINQITMPDTGSVFLDGEPLKPQMM